MPPPGDPRVDPTSGPDVGQFPRFPTLPPDATPAAHLRRSQEIASAYAETAYRLEHKLSEGLEGLTREVAELRSDLKYHVKAIAERTVEAKAKAGADLRGRDAAIGARLDELEHRSVPPPPLEAPAAPESVRRPPTSPTGWTPGLPGIPPVRQRLATLNPTELSGVRELARSVRGDFERSVADPATPAPSGPAVEAMVEARLKIARAEEKAALWDRLEAERKAAEDDRVAAAKAAETLRLELLALNGRERVRVKWVAIGGVVSTVLALLGALALRPSSAPSGARSASPAMVAPDGGTGR